MQNYQKLYTTLFNAVTDALEQLEQQNFGVAREFLRQAQQQTEEWSISAEESAEEQAPSGVPAGTANA